MTIVHNFQSSLKYSQNAIPVEWWEKCYQSAFPTLRSCVEIRNDGWAQRAGIDRCLILECGRHVTVDEKIRDKDYGDILLEVWSDKDKKTPGWAIKPLACDFIAYAISPAKKCYLLPTLMLQKTFQDNKGEWHKLAKKGTDGFAYKEAINTSWVTFNMAVPTDRLFAAMNSAMCVPWGKN